MRGFVARPESSDERRLVQSHLFGVYHYELLVSQRSLRDILME